MDSVTTQIYSAEVEGVLIHSVLAMRSGRVIGSVHMRFDCRGNIEVRRLHVCPRWRNRGIGRLLMEAVAREAVACDARWVCLSVPDWERGRQLEEDANGDDDVVPVPWVASGRN